MKIFVVLIAIIFTIAFSGCGKKTEEAKEAIEIAQKAPEMANKMQASMEAGKAKLEERRKKGDTLSLNYKILQEYIPTTIAGFEPSEPKGESVNAGGFSYSIAERRYVKKETNGNESYVNIKLMDYNQFYEGFNSITALWAQGITVENEQTLEKTFSTSIPNVAGYESFEKKNKIAKVQFGVGFRFFLEVEANNQSNTDFVKSIAESMKLSELTNL